MQSMRFISVLIITLLLSGCITLPANQGSLHKNISWPSRVKKLKQIQAWHLFGAIAIKTPEASQTASFNWQQQTNGQYSIGLYGPLGAGRVTLVGSHENVSLIAHGKHYQAATPESLMQKVLGWQLPMRNLSYWIRGIPAPSITAKQQFDSAERLSQLQQQGWMIEYLQYTGVHGVDLPTKIVLHNQQLTVKIVLSSWKTRT